MKASLHHGYNIYHFDIFIFSVLCLENSACSHWTFISNYNNYFNCTLTSSCEERKMFLYPSKTTSGNRICQPDLSEERRRRCNACNTFTPFCHGRCYFQRICLFAACSRSPFREDSGDTCSQIAMEAAEEDCHSDCSNMDQDSENAQKCHDCIEEHLVSVNASQCLNMSGASCWSCSLPVSENLAFCSQTQNNSLSIVQCIKRRFESTTTSRTICPSFTTTMPASSSTLPMPNTVETNSNCGQANLPPGCRSCICTLLCYWAPASDLCRVCVEEPEMSKAFVVNDHCPQGWTWAAETSKCYKAFPDPMPWSHADAFCKSGEGNLAQPKYNSSVYAMIESINIQTDVRGKFWIGSRYSDQGYIWVDGSTMDLVTNWGKYYPGLGIYLFI